MSYQPAEHAIEQGQTAAAWVVYGALLVAALGAGISDPDSHGGSMGASMLAQRDAVTASTGVHDERGHIGAGCADRGES